MALDVSDDYLIFDNTETVDVELKRPDRTHQHVVEGALRMQLTRQEQLLGASWLRGDEVAWNIPNKTLSGDDVPAPVFREGDKIIEQCGTEWVVATVQHIVWETGWRLICKRGRT